MFSQIPIVNIDNTIGGTSTDGAVAMVNTSDHCMVVLGYSYSNLGLDKSEQCFGSSDYWILKLDSAQNIIWQKTYGGSGYDMPSCIASTSDGGYIIGGTSLSGIDGNKTEPSKGGYDYWILKLDDLGNIEWQKDIGGNYNDFLSGVVQAQDGGYLVAGYSSSPIGGDKTESNLGQEDYWVLKFDSMGNVLWQNTIGGTDIDKCFSVVVDADGGFVLGGYSKSDMSADKSENYIGGNDFWIVQIDSIGNIVWDNTIGGSQEDIFTSICHTNDNGYLIGGYSNSWPSADKTELPQGHDDYWVLKLDNSGNVLWDKTIGSAGYDNLNCIVTAPNNQYLLAGSSEIGSSGDKTEIGYGSTDGWMVLIDSLGNLTEQIDVGGQSTDNLHSVIYDYQSNLIAGFESFSGISGDKSEDANSSDIWVAKFATKYNTIKGNSYFDTNSNLAKDSNEYYLQNKRITENQSGRFRFTNDKGNYKLHVLDTGNFEVEPPPISYWNSVPAKQNVAFNQFNLTDSMNDFVYQPAAIANDLMITAWPNSAFRPGFQASYSIHYKNIGNTILSPTITFYIDQHLSFSSSTIQPSFVFPDSVVYNLPDIWPFQEQSFFIYVTVHNGTPMNTLILSGVTIYPLINDADIENNSVFLNSTIEVWVTNSYDPNNVLVSPDTLYEYELSHPDFIDYIVNFQNTGNDTAFTVRVENVLSPMLDESTFEIVDASNTVTLDYNPVSRLMQYHFDNILLPDSNVDEPASHGYIHYKIKPRDTLHIGDVINNGAAIYFDFNTPVITDIAKVHIVSFCDKLISLDVSNFNACYGDIITVQNNSIFPYNNYTWTLDTTVISSNEFVSLSGLSVGTHTIQLHIDTLTCHVDATKNIIINALPVSSIVSNGDTLSSNANFVNYQWLNNGIVLQNSTQYTHIVNQNGWYQLMVSDANGCKAISDSSYMFHCNGLLAMNVPDSIVCPDEAFAAYNTSQTEYILDYEWKIDGNFLSSDTAIVVPAQNIGNHQLSLNIDTLNCTSTIVQNINVLQPVIPTFTFNGIAIVCDSGFNGFQWIFNGTPITSANQITFNLLLSGWYSIAAIDSNGCTEVSDSIYIDLSASMAEYNNQEITLFPNPSNDILHVKFDKSFENTFATINDMFGNVLISIQLKGTDTPIDVSLLSNGIYVMVVQRTNSVLHKCFINKK